ncbi:MAG TPA: YciI family protein [Solirubrobacteraceae bacterium]|nr:YciI family protein [Solirubrobacteraceae bacterium]
MSATFSHVLFYTYVPDMLERRAPYRERHLRRIEALRAAGRLIVAGAYGEPPVGAILGIRGLTREEVEAWADTDPYVTAGLVTDRRVEPWALV